MNLTSGLNRFFFGKKTLVNIVRDCSEGEILDLIGSENQRTDEELEEGFFAIDDKLACKFNSKKFQKEASFQIRFIKSVNGGWRRSYSYPIVDLKCVPLSGKTKLEGSIGTKFYYYLWNLVFTPFVLLIFARAVNNDPNWESFYPFILLLLAFFVVQTTIQIYLFNSQIKKMRTRIDEIFNQST